MTALTRSFFLGVLACIAAVALALPAAAATQHYDKASARRAIGAGLPVVVYVCADWSPLCRAQRPLVETLLKEPQMQSVTVFNASFDTDRELKQSLRIHQQGTLVVFKGGREVARVSAESDRSAIAKALASAVSGPDAFAGPRFDKDAFESAVASGLPVVLHVSATGCPVCEAQKPVVDALLRQQRMREVRLFVADFETDSALKHSLRISRQSTFVVFKRGREVARSTAEIDRDAITRTFEKAL